MKPSVTATVLLHSGAGHGIAKGHGCQCQGLCIADAQCLTLCSLQVGPVDDLPLLGFIVSRSFCLCVQEMQTASSSCCLQGPADRASHSLRLILSSSTTVTGTPRYLLAEHHVGITRFTQAIGTEVSLPSSPLLLFCIGTIALPPPTCPAHVNITGLSSFALSCYSGSKTSK